MTCHSTALPTPLTWIGNVSAIFLLAGLMVEPSAAQPTSAAEETVAERGPTLTRRYQPEIVPLLKQYCYDCHANEVTEADLDLAAFPTAEAVRAQTKVWLKVREMLESGQMPPPEADQPSDGERDRLEQWVRDFLAVEARAQAGDPGPVVLRRLNNAEYTYTIRDLTGVDSLDPTREFPVDGAAGEGFTNAGAAQAMSPSLVTKYLDAAKQVAAHAVLLPDGIRFSKYTSRRDQTDELLAGIQAFYRQFTEDGGGVAVNLQGIKFDTNQGGLLPVDRYLAAALAERDALSEGSMSVAAVARERRLNAKYLERLWNALEPTADSAASRPTSFLLRELRARWRSAGPEDAAALTAFIKQNQDALWKFNSIGHIGREGGPTAWMEAVSPLVSGQQLKVEFPAAAADSDVVIVLSASDLGDGNADDLVLWQRPRIEFPGGGPERPILLRNVRAVSRQVAARMAEELPKTAEYLRALVALQLTPSSLEELAANHGLDPRLLERWAAVSAIGPDVRRQITGHFPDRLVRVQNYAAINGWGREGTPSLLTNTSEDPITFLTLTIPARGVTVHPSPTLDSVVAWRSPIDGMLRLESRVADADDKCGNGAAWRIEHLSSAGRAVVAQGAFANGGAEPFQPSEPLQVHAGDVLLLIVNARDNNHGCDTTHIEFTLKEVGDAGRTWDLAADIVDNVLQSNPLPDAFGNEGVWHFCAHGETQGQESPIPPDSALARWREAVVQGKPAAEVRQHAQNVRAVLTVAADAHLSEPDRHLRTRLTDWNGPLQWVTLAEPSGEGNGHENPLAAQSPTSRAAYGLEAGLFGTLPEGAADASAEAVVAEDSLCLRAPHDLEIRLPAELVAGATFVTEARLHPASGDEGSVQVRVLNSPTQSTQPPPATAAAPILVREDSPAQNRLAGELDVFRNLFPPALCYARIVPVDEVVTLTLYYREDEHLQRLMLDEEQAAELDRLWDELLYVSREPLALTVAFEQIKEFATQDRPDLVKAFAPLEEPIRKRAQAFRQRLIETQPVHVQSLLEFAERAWRRPLTSGERREMESLYRQLREAELEHPEAVSLLLARVLTSPQFLYKHEQPPPGTQPAPVSDIELAVRLSYFLWSSTPDDELSRVARAGRLNQDAELLRQTRRMLQDERTRRLAVQFACQWLHVRNFDQNDDKNESLYPEFATLRGDMYEETVRFFEDLFRNNGSILDLLDADHTFLNEALARHYGIDGVSGSEWRRVDGLRARGRGGVLGMATVLASQSGASRTSPILRGNWVYETLLGERLPRPPANVPQLPDVVPEGLSARQLIEMHSSVPACAKCHAKIDPYGFALEQFDAIGRTRPQAVDTQTTLADGQSIAGLSGLRNYLTHDRRDEIVRQFCRKLLGYALGRETQLSDEPLLDEMQRRLAAKDYQFHIAVEKIVTSPQFRRIRGQAMDDE